jgi:isoquinoline 1-oxidoreductase beta subunit
MKILKRELNLSKVDRRAFLKTGSIATAGLTLGFSFADDAAAQSPSAAPLKFNAFVNVGADDAVTFMIHKGEMGQGTVTSLSQILAEEMDADFSRIKTEFPGVDPVYAGGIMQGVFGSLSIRTSWMPLRQAGAAAKDMLLTAAADRWKVSKAQCRAERGQVINTATNERVSFGSLAEAAAKVPVPKNVALKDPKDFKLVGTSPKRLDTPAKVDGSLKFGIDMRMPGLLYATVERCPVFGGKVASFDATRAKAVPGVRDVVAISNGVAVIADNTWAAMQGRKALSIKWDEGARANTSSDSLRKMFADMVAKPGAVARKEGNTDGALASATRKLDAVYEAPYLAHAPMEPLGATARVDASGCDIWVSLQIQQIAHAAAVQVAGLPADKVRIHTQYMGGGFGRRGGADFVTEAVEIAKAKPGVPVKLTWTREDDLQHDTYRPASYTVFTGALNAAGEPVAWHTRVACPSFGGMQNGVDRTGVEGIADIEYEIPNIQVEYHAPDAGIPVSYWRSVGFSQNTFFTESFLDELAVAAGKDPLEYRRKLLAKSPRMLAALNLAAEKAGWGKAPSGRFQGLSVVNNIGSYNAQVAEISVEKGKLKIHKIVCAVDCGRVVHPAIVEQQMQSGVVYGLSAALKHAITINRGRVEQNNFDDYDPLRIDEMPNIEVYIVPSTENPGGIGEASTPTVAPAVANAIFAATGKRLRSLPLQLA